MSLLFGLEVAVVAYFGVCNAAFAGLKAWLVIDNWMYPRPFLVFPESIDSPDSCQDIKSDSSDCVSRESETQSSATA